MNTARALFTCRRSALATASVTPISYSQHESVHPPKGATASAVATPPPAAADHVAACRGCAREAADAPDLTDEPWPSLDCVEETCVPAPKADA
eukprot:6196418-Pleurochrysis_carterae.AAC.6